MLKKQNEAESRAEEMEQVKSLRKMKQQRTKA